MTGASCKRAVELFRDDGPYLVGLFVNDRVPSVEDAADGSDYDGADWPGYDLVELVPYGPAVEEVGAAYQAFLPVAWVPAAPVFGYAYGLLVWTPAGDQLVEAVRFPAPRPLIAGERVPAAVRLRVRGLTSLA